MALDAELLLVPAELLAAAAVLEAAALQGPDLLAVAALQALAEPFGRGPTPTVADIELALAEPYTVTAGAELLAGLAWQGDDERLVGAAEQPRIQDLSLFLNIVYKPAYILGICVWDCAGSTSPSLTTFEASV